MICAHREDVVVGVRERVPWPLVRVAFLEPVCSVVGFVGSALCEVLRADEELCLLSEQQALGRGCCWRGLSLSALGFGWAGVVGVGMNCRCWEGEGGSACGFGWCSRC
jgi:hypothetical protein